MRVYKVAIAVLAAAVIIVGAVLAVKMLAPGDTAATPGVVKSISGSADEGATVMEVTEDENGNPVINERTE